MDVRLLLPGNNFG